MKDGKLKDTEITTIFNYDKNQYKDIITGSVYVMSYFLKPVEVFIPNDYYILVGYFYDYINKYQKENGYKMY